MLDRIPPCAVAAAAVILFAGSASAVIIDNGDGTGNTTAPPVNAAGWDHVGTVGGASGVYLGNRWVLTAFHVAAGDLTLDGVTYQRDTNVDSVRIENPGGQGLTQFTDLRLFKLADDPGLPKLEIASLGPVTDETVQLIGVGRDRAAALTPYFIDTDTDPPTWSTSASPDADATAAGYQWLGTRTKRWGTNTISDPDQIFDTDEPQAVNAGNGDVLSFFTDFDDTGGVTDEAQAAAGDSGGAVFRFNADTAEWELLGLMHAISFFEGQPGFDAAGTRSAVYGNLTWAADLSAYRDSINAVVVPEPATAAVLACAALWMATRRRRQA